MLATQTIVEHPAENALAAADGDLLDAGPRGHHRPRRLASGRALLVACQAGKREALVRRGVCHRSEDGRANYSRNAPRDHGCQPRRNGLPPGAQRDSRQPPHQPVYLFKSSEQAEHRGPSGGSSLFKGVPWNARKKKWLVQFGHDGQCHFVGCYGDEVEAALAYDAAIAPLNFAVAA
jgi:hypothetical protein